jgi:hypothetical protein
MTRSAANWFSAVLLVVFSTISSASAANQQTGGEAMNRAEKWVLAEAGTGGIADLSTQFPEEKDRKLSAHFLAGLLTGTLPGFKAHRNGVQITKATIEEAINLTNAQIPCDVRLDQCQFNSAVSFAHANVAGELSFTRCRFGQSAVFDYAAFEGLVSFVAADIAGNLSAQHAKFCAADFTRMNVRGAIATFNGAEFEGFVNFFQADIAQFFEMRSAKFWEDAFFRKLKVGGNFTDLTDTEFHSAAYFDWSDIAGNFSANMAKFHNSAYFQKFKLADDAVFDNAWFDGPGVVDFFAADIGGNFKAQYANFLSKKNASFNSIKIGQSAIFDETIFEGPVKFIAADIAGNFSAQNATFTAADFTHMNVRGDKASFGGAEFSGPVSFFQADIAGDFQLGDTPASENPASAAKFYQDASFQRMSVGREAVFNAVFGGPVDLRYADFGWLYPSGASWPDADNFYVQGMSYKYVLAPGKNNTELPEPLLKWAHSPSYTADVYKKLEEFFVSHGDRSDADEAFIEGKRQERRQYVPKGRGVLEYILSGDWLRWLSSGTLDLLVGYGRRPWKAAIFCIGFVALGCFLFSPKKMEQQRPQDAPGAYNRFWYSLGLFLPVVNLGADIWKPKADYTALRNWAHFHALAGWILIPIVLAAITGIIK